MNNDVSQPDVARLREQVLLAHIRIGELENTCAILKRSIEEERKMTEAAQRVADKTLGPHLEARSGDLLALAVQFERTVGDFKHVEARLLELDQERKAMQLSRSWRWTAPIRSIERWFTRRKGE